MRRWLPLLLVLGLALALAPVAPAATAVKQPRIVGGSVAPAGAFDSMAALVVPGQVHDGDGNFCGGTVIAAYAVLTAAHCIIQQQPTGTVTFTPSDFVVVTGTEDLSAHFGQHLVVRAIRTHPQFVQTSAVLDHDIAVVLLATPTSAPPAALSTSTPTSGSATVYGWGATDTGATVFPFALQTASLAIQPAGDCGAAFPSSICAGLTTPNVCIGDSGGPFLVPAPAGRLLAGVVSGILSPVGGPVTCGADSSGFTDVSLFTGWIGSQLQPKVSNPAMTLLPGGKLHVAWQLDQGGAAPAMTVITSDDPLHPHVALPGATSLDITGLPARIPLTVAVRASNGWGSASQVTVPGTVTLTGAPGLTGTAVANGTVSSQLVTNGAPVTVTAQFGPDVQHLANTLPLHVADANVAQAVSIPLTGLQPGRTYRVRLVAQSTGGTAVSSLLTFTTPGVKPVARALPRLRGTAKVGKTLTCTSGTWLGAPAPRLTYRWRIGTTVSSRFTTARLRLTTAMRGKKVACVVTARNVAGRVTVRSAAVTVRRR